MDSCPFCTPDITRVFHQDERVMCLWDAFPVSPGHALVVPRRHIPSWFEAPQELRVSLLGGVDRAYEAILREHQAEGFNLGINVHQAAGQTIPHLHIHVIPRYAGDVADPVGGVRNVIPGSGNYLEASAERTPPPSGDGPATYRLPVAAGLFGVDDAPLLPALASDLLGAVRLDMAVAFVLQSGLELLWPHLLDHMDRSTETRLRILTGDYMDATEPAALRRLLDLGSAYPDRVQARVFETGGVMSFHPKAYIVTRHASSNTAYIGSSNVSRTALMRGVEWNYRLSAGREAQAVAEIAEGFEALFEHSRTVQLTDEWIGAYSARRIEQLPASRREPTVDPYADSPPDVPQPHHIQRQALEALQASRSQGHRAGLIVLATGLGKTWLAAFDSVNFERVLFVAHREEILNQARETFRRIRPDARLGGYSGRGKDMDADVLFASVMTLGKLRQLEQFDPKAFDYIVVDEFHHASAATYRRLLDHFDPAFMLGLTATPDRTDGADLLALCGENLVFRCDVADGIRHELLSPFHYYGVPDPVDYANIPWRSGRFDPESLEHALVTEVRAKNAFEEWSARAGTCTLAFCVSQRHADYMCDYFAQRSVRCVAVHSGSTSAPRTQSLEQLRDGALRVVFSVDMFNEGVDVPMIDTVLMLRPTESRILWQQQFGRGLRRASGKSHVNVVDYIGNHRSFLQAPMSLLPGAGDRAGSLSMALERLDRGELELPPGCSVEYTLEAMDILRGLSKPTTGVAAITAWYRAFQLEHGVRPTATEAWHAGFDPKALRSQFGAWLGFVAAQDGLTAAEATEFAQNREFLSMLDTTPMTKSYKILLLQALCVANALPGPLPIDELTRRFRREANRSRHLVEDVGDALNRDDALQTLLEQNPVKAWAAGKGTSGTAYFRYEQGTFSSTEHIQVSDGDAFRSLVREVTDWRLAVYLARFQNTPAQSVRCRVSHNSSGRPILFLPVRSRHAAIPTGTIDVVIDNAQFEVDFVKIAVNVARKAGDSTNRLPDILRGWFGAGAGESGTAQFVTFKWVDDRYELTPEGPAADDAATLWAEYARPDIPALWALEFNPGKWNMGVVKLDKDILLLASLNTEGLADQHRYGNHFDSESVFEWQSQNKTTRDSRAGQALREHDANGVRVHLFVRRARKTPDGKGAPFTYCGPVKFESWQGDSPISVRWRLDNALPEHVAARFEVSGQTG